MCCTSTCQCDLQGLGTGFADRLPPLLHPLLDAFPSTEFTRIGRTDLIFFGRPVLYFFHIQFKTVARPLHPHTRVAIAVLCSNQCAHEAQRTYVSG